MKKVMNYAFLVFRGREKFKKMFLIMRLFSLIIFLGTLTVSAKSWSQQSKIDLQVRNSSVRDILLSIENNSRYFFIYDAEVIYTLDKKSIDVKEKSVQEVLSQLFEDTNVTYRIDDRQVFLYEKGTSQFDSFTNQRLRGEIKGRVTETSGDALPGVAVVVKGTTNGTITDFDGNYLLQNIPINATSYNFV